MTTRRRRNAEDFIAHAQRLGLRKVGVEWHGPCPVCGGDDRFHAPPKTGIVACHRNGCGLGELLRAAFPDDYASESYPSPRPARRYDPPKPPAAAVASPSDIARWWSAATAIPISPEHPSAT